jgi:mono/diheme cytochrome c family protein
MRHPAFTSQLAFSCLIPALLTGALSACGGDRGAAGGSDTAAATGAPAPPPPAGDTGAAPAAPPTDTGAAPTTPSDSPAPSGGGAAAGGGGNGSPQQIALGDSIFHGQAGGGTCYACHGQDGKGSGVGANLADSEWLHGDGSLESIVKTVKTGVPKPKQAPAPMPPMGGSALDDAQVQAVAAYVYSLSHGGGGG